MIADYGSYVPITSRRQVMVRSLFGMSLSAALRVPVAGLLVLAIALSLVSPARAADKPDFKALLKNVLEAWQSMDPAKAAPYYSKESNAVFYDIAPLKYMGWDAYSAGTMNMMKELA